VKQLIGETCAICHAQIKCAPEARFCAICKCPVHNDCVAAAGQAMPGACRKCKSPAAAVALRQLAQVQSAEATEGRFQLQRQGWLMAVGGGVIAAYYLLQIALSKVRSAQDVGKLGDLGIGLLLGILVLAFGLVISLRRRK